MDQVDPYDKSGMCKLWELNYHDSSIANQDFFIENLC